MSRPARVLPPRHRPALEDGLGDRAGAALAPPPFYVFLEDEDRVVVVTIQDVRSSGAATAAR